MKKLLYYKEIEQIENDEELHEELISAPQIYLEPSSFETEDSLKITLSKKNEDHNLEEPSMSDNVKKENIRQSSAMSSLCFYNSESSVKMGLMNKDFQNKKTRITYLLFYFIEEKA